MTHKACSHHDTDQDGVRRSYKDHAKHVLSRAEFVKLSSRLALGLGGASLLHGCHGGGTSGKPSSSGGATTSEPELKIGYLPITDAAPY